MIQWKQAGSCKNCSRWLSENKLLINVNQFTFVTGSFPGHRGSRHTSWNLPWPSTITSFKRHGGVWKTILTSPQGWGPSFTWTLRRWSDFMVPQNHSHWVCQLRWHRYIQDSKNQQQHQQEGMDVSNPPTPSPNNCWQVSVPASWESLSCHRTSYLSGWWPPRFCTWGAGSLWDRGCHLCAPDRSSGSLGERDHGRVNSGT